MITKEIEIEELVRHFPFSVKYLMEHGIKCIACGEPIWGTLEDAAKEKGFDQTQIEVFVSEMNHIAKQVSPPAADNQLPS
ncbi:hypothetical protein MASR2M12_03130 [Bacteroidales bacterium]